MDLVFSIALSAHLGLHGDYNSIHPHARYQHDSFIAGAYYNSEYAISPYVGVEIELGKDTTVELGAVGGYSTADVLPYARLKYKDYFISPAYENYNGRESIGAVLGIEFTF